MRKLHQALHALRPASSLSRTARSRGGFARAPDIFLGRRRRTWVRCGGIFTGMSASSLTSTDSVGASASGCAAPRHQSPHKSDAPEAQHQYRRQHERCEPERHSDEHQGRQRREAHESHEQVSQAPPPGLDPQLDSELSHRCCARVAGSTGGLTSAGSYATWCTTAILWPDPTAKNGGARIPPEITVRILYHAINGLGLGHMMRMSAVATAVRDRAPHVHQLIATNASFSAHFKRLDVPVIVLPDSSGPPTQPNRRVRSVSGRFASNLLNHVVDEYDPRLVVFDTHVPMRMARKVLEEGRQSALVLRACREDFLQRRYLARDLFALFDLVLVPHTREEFFSALSRSTAAQLRRLRHLEFVGPIVFPADTSTAAQREVCRRHRISDDAVLIVVSAGGGGVAPLARRMFDAVCAAAARLHARWPQLQVLCVGGPYGDPMTLPDRCTYVREEPSLQALLCRADLLIARSSYNTVHEALQCGTRAILVPATVWKTEDLEARVAFLEARKRVRRLTLNASAEEYAACIDQALNDPRPPPESFQGANCAAERLLALAAENQLFICSREPLARSLAFSFASPLKMARALTELADSRAIVRIDWDMVQQFLQLLDTDMRSRIDKIEVALGHGEVADIAERMRFVHALLTSHGAAHLSVLFCVNDPSGGSLLAELAALVRDLRFNALVARISADALQHRAHEIFDSLVSCRELNTSFSVDITLLDASTVFVDQP